MDAKELLQRYSDGERDFSGVEITDMNFKEVNLSGANLTKANLRGSNFYGADLRNVNLRRRHAPASWVVRQST